MNNNTHLDENSEYLLSRISVLRLQVSKSHRGNADDEMGARLYYFGRTKWVATRIHETAPSNWFHTFPFFAPMHWLT